MKKAQRLLNLFLCGCILFMPMHAWAITITMTGNGTWASAGTQGGSGTINDAAAGQDVALAGHTLTVTNDQMSNDGSGFDAFNLGNIMDSAAGSILIQGTQGSTNDLTVNFMSSVVANADFKVENTDGANADNVLTSITSNLTTGTLEVLNNQATSGAAVKLTVGGNLSASGQVTITSAEPSGANAVLSLQGSSITAAGFVLNNAGASPQGNPILDIGSNTNDQTVTGVINGAAAGDGIVNLGSDINGSATNKNIVISNNIGTTHQVGIMNLVGTGSYLFNGLVNVQDVNFDSTSSSTFNQALTTSQIDFWGNSTATFVDGANVSGNINSGGGSGGNLVFQGNSTFTGDMGEPSGALNQISLTGSGKTVSVSGGVVTDNLSLGTNTLNLTGSSPYIQYGGGTLSTTLSGPSTIGSITSTSAYISIPSSTTLNVAVNGSLPSSATNYTIVSGVGTAPMGVAPLAAPDTIDISGTDRFFTVYSSSDDLILRLAPDGGLATYVTGSNGFKAATALDAAALSATGDMSHVIGELNSSSLTPAQVNTAINSMLPQTNATVQAPAQIMDGFVDTQMTHLQNPIQLPSSGGNMAGMAAGDQPDSLSVWSQVYGTQAHQSARGDSDGYDLEDTGAVVGVEEQANDSLRLGLAAGDGYSWIDSKDEDGRTNINAITGSFYAGFKSPDDPYYLNFAGIYGYNIFDSSRDINVGPTDNRKAKSNYDGSVAGGYMETGYGVTVDNIVITPNMAVDYDRLHMPKYTEKDAGALDLTVQAQNYNRLQLAPGIKMELPLVLTMGTLTPEIHAKFLDNVIDDQVQTVSSFTGGGTAFTTSGFKPAKIGTDIGLSLTLATLDNWTWSLKYDFEYFSDYFSNSGLLNVAYKF